MGLVTIAEAGIVTERGCWEDVKRVTKKGFEVTISSSLLGYPVLKFILLLIPIIGILFACSYGS